MEVTAKVALITLLDQVMPGISGLLQSTSEDLGKDKLVDFVEKYWHYGNVLKMGKVRFIANFNAWATPL